MTPADFQLVLTAMPWNAYTQDELRQIQMSCLEAISTCRIRGRELHRVQVQERLAKLQEEMAARPEMTAEQIQAGMVKSNNPVGSRFD